MSLRKSSDILHYRVTGAAQSRFCPRCNNPTLQVPLDRKTYRWHCLRCDAYVSDDGTLANERRGRD